MLSGRLVVTRREAGFSLDPEDPHRWRPFEPAPGDRGSNGVLYRQPVPIERVFMTYFETAQMNRQFEEAEVVLFWDANNPLF